MNGTRFAVLAVVVLLFTSGCLGSGGGPAAPGGTTTDSGNGGVGGDGAGGFDTVDSFDEIRTDRQMADYIDRSPLPVYRPGEFFRYEGVSSVADDVEAPEPTTMTIESGEGGEWLDADIEVTLVRGDRTISFTEEDPEMMFTPELTFTANGRAWVWIYYYNQLSTGQLTRVEPRISELKVGDSWTFESDGETALAFSVTRAETYAGVDCVWFVTEMVDGGERSTWTEACVAPDVGLPLYFVQYDGDGAVEYEMELVEYRR